MTAPFIHTINRALENGVSFVFSPAIIISRVPIGFRRFPQEETKGLDMRKGKIFTRHDYERLVNILEGKEGGGSVDATSASKLKRDLEHSHLVDPRDIRPNIVTMNSKVCLKDLGNGKKEIYSLVFPAEAKGDGALSVFSRIGTELLGSTIGTVVKKTPSGEQYFVIEEILYQPEAAGDYHL